MGRGSVGVRSPLSSGTARCICGGHGRKVTRLTLGDLRACLVRGLPRGSPMSAQKSAEGRRVVAATRGPNKGTRPDAVVSSADGGAVLGTETPQRPRKEAAGSRHEPGLVRPPAPASTDPIGPQTQTLHSTPGSAAEHLNRRVRNRTHGGVGGREGNPPSDPIAGCRPSRSCRGPKQPESLLTKCLLDGEAYAIEPARTSSTAITASTRGAACSRLRRSAESTGDPPRATTKANCTCT